MKDEPFFRWNGLLVTATGRSFQNEIHNTHALLVRQHTDRTKRIVSWKSRDEVAWDVLDMNSDVPSRLVQGLKIV